MYINIYKVGYEKMHKKNVEKVLWETLREERSLLGMSKDFLYKMQALIFPNSHSVFHHLYVTCRIFPFA